ncbi:MAG: VacB/RNase II family 3'-5' exoribonuclease [Phycisphaerales bacterium]|nr:VacB/RNase II family 3'-5' exoribonuclease [Phycisphaerales bacterium]
MPLRYRARVVDHLSHEGYKPVPLRILERQMKVPDGDRELFRSVVRALAQDGTLQMGVDEVVRLPRHGNEVIGVIRMNARGFGFVKPESASREGDLHIPAGKSLDAISGDRVRVEVVRRRDGWDKPGRDSASGRVIEIITRGQTRFAGTLLQDGKRWIVKADGRSLAGDVIIRDPHAKGAKAGDKVAIEVLRFPSEDRAAEAVIVDVLGSAGEPDVETAAVILTHGLRTEFPAAAIHEASSASRQFEADCDGDWSVRGARERFPNREDLTGSTVFTIDPPDARDFDDAISISHNTELNEWILGVHIADVAHFVRASGPIDTEGAARGNSTYLPRRVIPMLPEVLSNGVCSLQEGVPRLTRSAFITFDGSGVVLGQRLAATIIRSAKRLTYLEAQALIEGDEELARKHARTDTAYSEPLRGALRLCDKLSRLLRKRRLKDGMIVLSLPESDLVFDETGRVADVVPEDTAFTHTLIEMFMVEANEALARTFAALGVPLLRRIHPDPVFGDIEELAVALRAAGMRLGEEPSRQDLQRVLDSTRGTTAERAVHFSVLRTMSKATYSPAIIGHYALASAHYAHFTSPIRRYPDLLVHRVMDAYVDATENGRAAVGGRARKQLASQLMNDARVPNEGTLIDLGRHCSATEVSSERAERELRTFLVLQFLHDHHMGAELPGVVTGVMPSGTGIWVTLDKYLVDGMIRARDLAASSSNDRWSLHQLSGRLVSSRGGASIGIGDAVIVTVAAVDLAGRNLTLTLTKMPERTLHAAGEPEQRRRGGRHLSKEAAPESDSAPSESGESQFGRKGGRRGTKGRGADGHKKGFKKGRRGRRSK